MNKSTKVDADHLTANESEELNPREELKPKEQEEVSGGAYSAFLHLSDPA
jgi:hypothetical protein